MKNGFLYSRHFLPPRLTIPVKIALPVPFKHTRGPPESPLQNAKEIKTKKLSNEFIRCDGWIFRKSLYKLNFEVSTSQCMEITYS